MESDGGGSTLEAGDVIEVSTPQGTVDYTVERTERYAKGELAGATEVWESSPGRLVLLTCFQRGGGRASTENLVVFAHS
jgi:sortase (surface protein transpeptidase)